MILWFFQRSSNLPMQQRPLVLTVAQTEARQAGRQAEVGDFSGSCMDSAAG